MNKKLNNNDEITKKKISEKDAITLKYKQRINDIKQRYGIEFDVDNFENHSLKNIRFHNLSYKKDLKEIEIFYNASNDRFCSLMYSYTEESTLKSVNRGSLLPDIAQKYKLNMIISEIKKLTVDYKNEIDNIDRKYENMVIDESEYDRVLEMRKTEEN